MSINKRNFAHLTSRINLLDPSSTSRRELLLLTNAAITDLEQMSLPEDDRRVALNTQSDDDVTRLALEAENTLSQWRHSLRETYMALLDRITTIPFQSGPEHQSELAKVTQSLQSSIVLLKDLAAEDRGSIYFQPFKESDIGRKKLAKAIRSAHEQVGNNISEARPIIDAEMTLAYRENLDKYLDEQFPVTHDDELRPTLNHKEALILAHEFYDTMDSHSDLPDCATRIAAFVCECQNAQRFNLPAIEGIATAPYWEQRIVENFENAPLLEDYDHLMFRGSTLQDELPVDGVLRTLDNAGRAMPLNPANPVIYYLDDLDDPEICQRLIELGQTDENCILVIRGHDGTPITVTNHSPDIPDTFRVVCPNHAGMVVRCPNNGFDPVAAGTTDRLDAINKAAQMAPRLIDYQATEEALERISEKWRSLVANSTPSNSEKLSQGIEALTKELQSVSPGIIVPEYSADANAGAAQQLVDALIRTGAYENSGISLEMRLPNGAGTVMDAEPPHTCITFHTKEDRATTDIEIKSLSGKQLHYLPNISTHEANEVARKAASEHGNRTGIKNNYFPHGFMTFHLTEGGEQAHSIGHWISDEDRKALTEKTPTQLAHSKVKGEPLLGAPDRDAQQQAIHKMGGTAAMIHGSTLDDFDLALAGEMALSGVVMLEVDAEDQFGCLKFNMREEAYYRLSNEDLKRHLQQKIVLSDAGEKLQEQMCSRIGEGHWSSAISDMDRAFEEVELSQSESSMRVS
ncbi:hypothetical protein AWH63_21305 [Marinobacter sp. C18]|uniref:hypothetical protein n=1 Tax=Marinobacter sp. C18 TaxID=1772288 RepID=UPI000948911D|nr:hypothetical protein [Marinobacter sp. C18]OLF83450.1 hypothetical protein AWH63_21305 [Marinobacter sp. C18]